MTAGATKLVGGEQRRSQEDGEEPQRWSKLVKTIGKQLHLLDSFECMTPQAEAWGQASSAHAGRPH